MTAGTVVRVVGGPYIAQRDRLGHVLPHHPGDRYVPVRVREHGEARVLHLRADELQEVRA